MQVGWADPARFVLGHPVSPPHLIPLVEVMGTDRTVPGVVEWARAFYASVGETTIEVRREVPGHVANRLPAALWREAIAPVESVQRGMRTPACTQGRIVYDAEAGGTGLSEHGVHRATATA